MLPVGSKPPCRNAVSFSVTGGPSVTVVVLGVVLSVGSFWAICYPSAPARAWKRAAARLDTIVATRTIHPLAERDTVEVVEDGLVEALADAVGLRAFGLGARVRPAGKPVRYIAATEGWLLRRLWRRYTHDSPTCATFMLPASSDS